MKHTLPFITMLTLTSAALASVRRKVEDRRLTAPLFDSAVYTRGLESAYRAIHARRCAGLGPAPVKISAE